MRRIAHQIKMNKKLLIILGIGIFVLLASIGIYAKTVITDNQITAQNFNMSGGRFNQQVNVLSLAGYIQDNSSGGTAHYLDGAKGIYVSGTYAYIASQNDDSVCIFDLYNPSNITEISCIRDNSSGGTAHYLDGAKDLSVQGNYLYVTAINDNALSVFDVSNPTNISEVGYIRDNSVGGKAHALSGIGELYTSGKYAYVTGQDDNAFSILDISDPTNITEVGYIQDVSKGGTATGLDTLRQFSIEGDYAYVLAYGNNSLSIFDISNPTNITEAGYLQDASSGGTATAMNGPRDIFVSGKYAYIVAKNAKSLTVVDISNKSNPVQISSITDDSVGGRASSLNGVYLIEGAGNYAYTASRADFNNVCLFDVSNPYNIKEIQCVSDNSSSNSFLKIDNPVKLFLSGNYLYMTSAADDSLSIFEISGVETPSVKTGTLEASLIDVLGNLRVLRDVYIGNGLNVAGTGLFSSGLSVMKSLEVIGNLTINNHKGISGNYSNGNCWAAYSGGIIYETNCTSN